jgi:hypothetical protein
MADPGHLGPASAPSRKRGGFGQDQNMMSSDSRASQGLPPSQSEVMRPEERRTNGTSRAFDDLTMANPTPEERADRPYRDPEHELPIAFVGPGVWRTPEPSAPPKPARDSKRSDEEETLV